MAKNTGNKRAAVKHIRDGIKSNYKKKDECEVCGTSRDLELHHYNTVSILFYSYCDENNIPYRTDEEVLAMRSAFYDAYWHELVEDTVTLCADHHKQLHKLYGREPELKTAPLQRNWVQKFHGRLFGKDADSLIGRFSKHIIRNSA